MTSTLTSNLHNLFVTFFTPDNNRDDRKGRRKILCEAKAFPSDQVSLNLGRGRQASLTFHPVLAVALARRPDWTIAVRRPIPPRPPQARTRLPHRHGAPIG